MAKAGSGKRKMQAQIKKEQRKADKTFDKSMKSMWEIAKGIGMIAFAPLTLLAPKKKKRRRKRR